MKKYKFHIGYPQIRNPLWRDVEEYLESMQNRGWEFVGVKPPKISNGYTEASEGYIFRREMTEEVGYPIQENEEI